MANPHPVSLLDSLIAFDRAQGTWLSDVRTVFPRDAACLAAFTRWEIQLTAVKLAFHQAEQRLYGSLSNQTVAPLDDMPGADQTIYRQLWQTWRTDLEDWFTTCRLPSSYRRIDSCLDTDQDAINADIITDFATLTTLAESCSSALASCSALTTRGAIEDLAFYQVIAPWRTRGMPALLDVLRWLSETRLDQDDW